ncbi:hypothetical protein [Roseateles sp.]
MDLIRSMHPMSSAWLLDGPLARLQDPNVVARRFRADDELLKFLKIL